MTDLAAGRNGARAAIDCARESKEQGLDTGAGSGMAPAERQAERPAERPAGVRPIGAPGQMGVDYEERVDFGRLREYRIERARAALRASQCGALLLFDLF